MDAISIPLDYLRGNQIKNFNIIVNKWTVSYYKFDEVEITFN